MPTRIPEKAVADALATTSCPRERLTEKPCRERYFLACAEVIGHNILESLKECSIKGVNDGIFGKDGLERMAIVSESSQE